MKDKNFEEDCKHKKNKNDENFKNEKTVDDACGCDENCECKHNHINSCDCNDSCQDENCDCGCGEDQYDCGCGDDCECGCEGKHKHHENCCGHDTGEHCDCGHEKHHHNKVEEYLQLAQRLQADFENYRRHVADQLDKERQTGAVSVIQIFLPCLDTFKDAKKNISDDQVLSGINMIENKILEALKTAGVEKIAAKGEKFNPHLHEVVTCTCDKDQEEDIILEEFQSGWMFKGKVIRYSKVLVNKHE